LTHRQKEHPDRQVAGAGCRQTVPLQFTRNERVGDLGENAGAIAGLAICGRGAAMGKAINGRESIPQQPVRRTSRQICYESGPAICAFR
jgi:hypothetical protein